MISISEWEIGKVCRRIAVWQADGITALSVAVNLAATQLRERRLPKLVWHPTQANGLPSGMFEIELTASILVVEPELSRLTAERRAPERDGCAPVHQ